MLFINRRFFLIVALTCLFVSCSTLKKPVKSTPGSEITAIKFLGEYDIPYSYSYNNTTVGGLSGMDYNARDNNYYMISDDRSAINPARYYTAKIAVSNKGIDSVNLTSVHFLLQKNGNVYPNSRQDPFNTPDPEAMRYDPVHDQLVWSSEGERIVKPNEHVLADPAIRVIGMNAEFIDSFTIPANLRMQEQEKGPRQNGVFEGLAFTNGYKSLFVSVEEPLYDDGPRADVMENNAYIRLLKFDVANKKCIEQYAYKLEPVAYAPSPITAFKINGVSDILSITNKELLVIERSFSTGRLACTIKLFLADLSNASNVENIHSLNEHKDFKPVEKKLLLNLDDLGFYTDNIEGVTFGPVLPNGHRTLLFIADNNFSPLEKSQILLFEIVD